MHVHVAANATTAPAVVRHIFKAQPLPKPSSMTPRGVLREMLEPGRCD
jgi:hypothetical protein